MIFLLRNDGAACGVGVPAAMMAHELATKDFTAPVHLLAVDFVRQLGAEAMVGGAQGDEGFTGVDILHNHLPFIQGKC